MIDWDSIKHFTCGEFDSPDEPGSGDKMSLLLVQTLDAIREKLDYPLTISSGYRTATHNAMVGGKTNSAHRDGEAVDIIAIPGNKKYNLVFHAIQHGIKRIGIGPNFVHLDVSNTLPRPSIWSY